MVTINSLDLTKRLTARTAHVWAMLCEIRPALVKFDPPSVRLNNRLWRVAGMNYQETNIIDIGTKFFIYSADFHAEMFNVILPHEIIHQADYNLYGDSELNCGHGAQWCKLMLDYGLPANKYHSLEIPKNFTIKWTKAK